MLFNPGDHVVDYIDDALHDLLSAADESYVRAHCAECPICSVALEEARRRNAALSALPTPEVAPALVGSVIARVRAAAESQVRRQRIIRRWALRAVAALILLMAGLHIYFATYRPSPYDLRLLGQEQLLAGAPGSIRAQLLRDNVPVKDATITLALHDSRMSRTVQLASYTTDAAGTGSPRFTLPDWPDGDYTLQADASADFHTESLSQTVSLRREARLMVSTDKPVYQPGQTLHARALALRRPDLKPVAATEALFTLTDPKGNIVFKQAGVTSSFGIASMDCPLASEIIQGSYTLLCRVGTTESTTAVEIKHYALPKFKVSLTTDKPFYAPGDRVRATIQADYFFNQHVANAQVDLNVTTAAAGQQAIANLATTTDPSGRATVEFILPTHFVGTEQDGGDARVTFTATLRDSARQEQSRSLSFPVTTSPIHIDISPESTPLVRDLANRIFILTTYADGRPAKVRLNVAGLAQNLTTNDLGVATFELTPQSDPISLTVQATDDAGLSSSRRIELSAAEEGDYLVRTDKSVYRTGQSIALEIIATGNEPVFIDLLKDGQTMHTSTVPLRFGHGSLAIDLSPELAGTLQLNAYRYGSTGLAIHKTHILYVQPADDLQIKATLDHPEFRPGDTARLSIHLSDAKGNPVPGAVSLAAVDEAVFSVLDKSPGLEKNFFTLDQQMLQPLATVYNTPDFFKTDPDHLLFSQAFFSRATTATVGRDAILNRLVERGDISPRMLRNLDSDWGRRYFHDYIQSSDLPEAQKAMLLDSGPFSLDARTGPENILRAERIQQARRDWVPLLWGAVIIASGFTLLFVFARSFVLAALLTLLMSGCLISLLLPSLGRAREMSNRVVTAAGALGIVESMKVANADNPNALGTTGATNSPSPHLRQYFPETLLWRPELITDDLGNAALDIPLADSITTWRLSASAVSASGQLGATQSSIRVFQPFFIDLNIPAALTRNDEISAPAIVYNYLDAPQTVVLSLPHADWFDLLDPETKSISLAPAEVKSVYFRIRVTKAGIFNLRLSGRASNTAGEIADALQRSVEVVPDGQPVESTSSGTLSRDPVTLPLTIPSDAIDGSLHATLKIYPSTFSQLVEGLDNIFQMPSGCFEQTSSTTYPNILALDYLRQTKKSLPQTEATARQYINLGYQRLLSFEINGGGFDWFGNPPANRTLTAYGLMEFQDMANVYNVDPAVIARTRNWLLAQQQSDGSWEPGRAFYHDDPTALGDAKLSTTAYIIWSAFNASANASDSKAMAAQNYLRTHADAAKSNPYTAALVANALLAIAPNDAVANDLLATLETTRQTSPDNKLTHWSLSANRYTTFYGADKSAEVETTALAALAMLKSGNHSTTAHNALAWLVANKDPQGTWHSTQATVLALKALLAGTTTAAGNNDERRVAVELDGQIIQELRIPADQSDVLKSFDLAPFLTPGNGVAHSLRLIPRAGPDIVYQVTTQYHAPGLPPSAPKKSLDIALQYDHTQLALNDSLHATVILRNSSADPLPMILLDLPIPAGFSADATSLNTLQSRSAIEKYQITSRQIIVYLRSLDPTPANAAFSFSYTLRALIPVKVQAPPASAYEYYNPENRATAGQSLLQVNGG